MWSHDEAAVIVSAFFRLVYTKELFARESTIPLWFVAARVLAFGRVEAGEVGIVMVKQTCLLLFYAVQPEARSESPSHAA